MSFLRQKNPIVIAIIAGLISLFMAIAPLKTPLLIIVFNYFSCLPLFFIALCWGLPFAGIAALTVITFIFTFLGLAAGFLHLVTSTIPFMIMAWWLYQKDKNDLFQPVGFCVSLLTTYTIFLFIAGTFILTQNDINPVDLITKFYAQLATKTSISPAGSKILLFFPALGAISISITLFTNMALAHHFAKKIKMHLRPLFTRFDAQFHLHWDIILAAALLLQLTDHQLFAFIGGNIALMACVPIFCLGLNIIFEFFSQAEKGIIWFWVFGVMCFLLVWLGIIVVLIGILEPSLKIRKRLIK